MRTIHVNKKAAAIAIGSLFFTGLIVLYSFSIRNKNGLPLGHKILLARDINNRIKLSLEKLGDFRNPKLQLGLGIPDVKYNGKSATYSVEEVAKAIGRQDRPEKSNAGDVVDSENNWVVERKKQSDLPSAKAWVKEDNHLNDENSDAYRSNYVREMMIHAWDGYRKYAWGKNEVRPIALKPFSQGIFGGSSSNMAATIVDALDTLWIMGLREQFDQGRDYVKEHLNIEQNKGTISVFETTIRFIGGFLSAYALTHDTLFVDKSVEIANALLRAFNTETGLPKSTINLATGAISNYGWASGGSSILSEIGTLHLEFVYLSHLTNNSIYEQKVKSVRDHLDRLEKVDGLYPNYISSTTGQWVGRHVSLGAMGDSFYEYLLKSYIHTNDTQGLRMYKETVEAILQKMLQKSKGGLTYIGEWRNGIVEHKMGHLACFCVGMFALQSDIECDPERKKKFMTLAKELGNTCHESYIRSSTGLGPEMFYFTNGNEAKTSVGEFGYILRPEVLEGWFYLWRLTADPMYKEWVWDAVKAIEKYCKKEGGYAGITNVYDISEGWDDVQQSFFLAETLKYAYLTFVDESVLSFEEWVFNTEAHPFPILVHTSKC